MNEHNFQRFVDLVGQERLLDDPLLWAAANHLCSSDDPFDVLVDALKVACAERQELQQRLIELAERQSFHTAGRQGRTRG